MTKFSISSLLICVTVIAVAICAYKISQQSTELSIMTDRLEVLEHRERVYRLATQLSASLDRDDPETEFKEGKILSLLFMLQSIPDASTDPAAAKAQMSAFRANVVGNVYANFTQVGDPSEALELFVMHFPGSGIPGSITTVVALFKNGIVAGHVFRCKSTREEESHRIEILENSFDDTVQVVIEVEPTQWGKTKPETFKIVYDIDESGFDCVTMDTE